MAEVYLDGRYLGTVEEAEQFVEDLRDQRRNGQVVEQVNVYHNKDFDEVVRDAIMKSELNQIKNPEDYCLLNTFYRFLVHIPGLYYQKCPYYFFDS